VCVRAGLGRLKGTSSQLPQFEQRPATVAWPTGRNTWTPQRVQPQRRLMTPGFDSGSAVAICMVLT
jgi:hypothetical protein